MTERRKRLGFLALMLMAFAPPMIGEFPSKPPLTFVVPRKIQETAGSPFHKDRFVFKKPLTRFAHSPALTEMADGRLLLVWFGGSGEARPNVGLYRSTLKPQAEAWTQPRLLTNREQSRAELGRYLHTIGNPALWTGRDGKVWLFYVTSSVRGWSGSSINFKGSDDNGDTWTGAKRLVTSPFFNSGTLVRGRPFAYQGAEVGLPVYHELLGVFPELLRVSQDGAVLGKSRIYHGKSSLQPSIVPLDETRAIALLRPRPSRKASREARVLLSRTTDAGKHWSTPAAVDLSNPGSSVVGLRIADGSILAAFNDSATSRNDLSLAQSRDYGESWRVLTSIEHSEQGQQFAYPSLVQTTDGHIHLVYAWNYARIKHVEFNAAWLEQPDP
jgi:predicted neuraminidase